MPRAEEDTSVRGLPPGAEQTQDRLAAVAPDETLAPPVPIVSPVNQPAPEEAPDKFTPPSDLSEQLPPNIDPNLGFDPKDMLFGPTTRPEEPVTIGLPNVAPPKVSHVIQGLLQTTNSADLKALLRVAQNLDL